MRSLTFNDGFSTLSALAVTLFHLTSVSAFAQCYYPDGSIPTDFVWEPCTGSKYSSCCVPSEGDICQPNGLCYYPLLEQAYRGTCTDRTWNDSACPSDICVTGFETTWIWASDCKAPSGEDTFVCGKIDEVDGHVTPTCAAHAVSVTASFITTRSSSSAGRYTPPPSLDSNIYTSWTSTYTTIITANVQTTTQTSTFASTFTSKISVSTTTSSATTKNAIAATSAAATATSKSKGITLTTGALIGIIVGPILFIALALCVFLLLRKRRTSARKASSIPLNSTNYPPPNGPVGADQVHPYEVLSNEVAALPQKYAYMAPQVEAHEMDDRGSVLKDIEKRRVVVQEMEAGAREPQLRSLRSPTTPVTPAPAYAEAMLPVELDAVDYGRLNNPHGRF